MKRFIASFAVAGVLLVAISMSATAMAKNKLQQVLDRGVLIVGTGGANPPWHFKNKHGDLVGFDIDIAKIIANGLFNDPNKVKFVVQSDSSRVANLTTNKVDITCQFMTVTAGRAQQVAFTVPYYREGVGLLLRKGGNYQSYKALKKAGDNVTISVLENVYAKAMVHKSLLKAHVNQYNSPGLMYQALNSGRADAAATDVSSLKWFMKKNPGRYLDSGYYWNPQSYSCAVKQGQPIWLHYVNTTLKQAMMGVGFPAYSSAFEHWFGEKPTAPKIGFPQEFR